MTCSGKLRYLLLVFGVAVVALSLPCSSLFWLCLLFDVVLVAGVIALAVAVTVAAAIAVTVYAAATAPVFVLLCLQL